MRDVKAKDIGVPLGTIECPHCGYTVDGIIEPICPICDQPYWDYIKIDMEKID